YLRRRGRLAAPACATATDLAGLEFRAHPGIDLHLVMHESCVAPVERVAGPDSAHRVRPLVAPAFFKARSRVQARRALGLPLDRPVVGYSYAQPTPANAQHRSARALADLRLPSSHTCRPASPLFRSSGRTS